MKIKGQKIDCTKCHGALKKDKKGFVCKKCQAVFPKKELVVVALKKGGLEDYKNKNYANAVKKFSKVAKADDAEGQYYLGVCFDVGNGCKQDHKKAAKWFLKAAKQGNMNAQYNLGNCYEEGEGVQKSVKRATEWYEKAAAAGHLKATNKLQEIKDKKAAAKAMKGDKTAKPVKPVAPHETDDKEIETVLKPAQTPTPAPLSKGTPANAEVTMPDAVAFGVIDEEDFQTPDDFVPFNSRAMLEEQNAPKNPEPSIFAPPPRPVQATTAQAQPTPVQSAPQPAQATAFGATQATAQPNFTSNFSFAPSFPTAPTQPVQPAAPVLSASDYYQKGLTALEIGNAVEAVKNFETAAKGDHAEAQLALGNCYLNGNGVMPDYAQAVTWLEKAAEKNNAKAQYLLGSLYLNGQGVAQDVTKAARLYGQAANQGDALAQLNLANCYVNGTGVPRDLRFACIFYERAANQGNANAQYYLGLCHYNGWGVDKNWLTAKAWYEKAAAQGQGDAIKALRDSRWE